jgi:hypothetical protein
MNKLKKILITLGILILATLGYETKDQIVGGFNTMRGFTTLSGDSLNVAMVTISSASFGELATTSVELLPRPAVGYVNQVVSVTGYRVFSSESWNNNNAGAPTIGYSNGTNKFAITASLSKGLFSGNGSSTVASPSYIVVNPAIAYSAASNSAVVLRRAITTTEPSIDGDTYFKFFILYRVINFN